MIIQVRDGNCCPQIVRTRQHLGKALLDTPLSSYWFWLHNLFTQTPHMLAHVFKKWPRRK
jgi:hypothetical protein